MVSRVVADFLHVNGNFEQGEGNLDCMGQRNTMVICWIKKIAVKSLKWLVLWIFVFLLRSKTRSTQNSSLQPLSYDCSVSNLVIIFSESWETRYFISTKQIQPSSNRTGSLTFSRAFGSVLISSTSSHRGPCGIPFWLEWLLCFVLFFFLRLSIFFFFFFLTLSDKFSILCLEDYQSFFLWKKLNLRGRVVYVGKCTGSISSQNEPPWICKYVYVAWWAKCKNLYGNKRCRHFQPKNLN